MTYYSSTITYAGQSINVLSLDPVRIQAPYIQKMGRSLVYTSVATDALAWRIVINCEVVGAEATLTAARVILQDAHDDKLSHAFADGVHDGNYVCEDLKFVDDGNSASMKTHIRFTLTLLEKKFEGGY